MQDVRKTMIIGFIFGVIFSIIGHLANFNIDYVLLWVIPLLTASLSGLGSIVAVLVSNYLNAKGFLDHIKVSIIAFIAAAMINILIMLAVLSFIGIGTIVIRQELILGAFLGLGMGAVYGIYRYRVDTLKEKMEFLEALAEKNRKLQEATRSLAIIEERNRMGRELHDSVSQGLHGIVFALHSLRNELNNPPQRVSEIVNHIEATAGSTLDELRTMIEELKPSLIVEYGLEKALKITADLFSQRQKIPVECQFKLPETLSPELEMTIYRITQESLANIEKHAFAQLVNLKIFKDQGHLILTITDDGKGFDHSETLPGNGLNNMRRRAEEVGGTIDIISKSGIGTSIIVKFPEQG